MKNNEQFLKFVSPYYLRDWIYGGIDGTITTFAVVSGVVGGHLSPLVILILGFANLLADGFSMAAGNYLSTKAEVEQYQHYQSIEAQQINASPETEKKFMREIFQKKGITGEALEKLVAILTINKSLWLNTLLNEKYGIPIVTRSPFKAALNTFFAFVFFGLVPLIPYVLVFPSAFLWSSILTALVFFFIGSLKSYWSLRSWYYSGIETLLIGVVTATLSYAIGLLLHLYFNS